MDDQMLMNFHEKWSNLKPGPQAELRRVREPDELLDRPAFYHFVSSLGWKDFWREGLSRLIFCIPYISHSDRNITLGAALGNSGNEYKTVVEMMPVSFGLF